MTKLLSNNLNPFKSSKKAKPKINSRESGPTFSTLTRIGALVTNLMFSSFCLIVKMTLKTEREERKLKDFVIRGKVRLVDF